MADVLSAAAADAVVDALPRYTERRLARTTAIVRKSRRMGAMAQWQSPAAVAVRDTLLRAAGRFAPDAALRPLDDVLAWRPPVSAPSASPAP